MSSDTPRYASPDDVERHAEAWPEAYLQCRLYGHEWRPVRATHYPELRYVYTVQRCPRCTSTRHSELSERGAVLATWMEYAEGYLTQNVGRIVGAGRDVLRVAALSRVFDLVESHDLDRPHSRATREAIGLDDAPRRPRLRVA